MKKKNSRLSHAYNIFNREDWGRVVKYRQTKQAKNQAKQRLRSGDRALEAKEKVTKNGILKMG